MNKNETPEITKSTGINIDYIYNESPLVLECKHFIKCCNEHIQPITDGDEGLRVLTVLDAAQQSLNNQSYTFFLMVVLCSSVSF